MTHLPPYQSQFASDDLVSDILDGRRDPSDDPRWKEFGFASREDYAFWSWRGCGLVAVKMVLDAFQAAGGESVASLTMRAVDLGGYKVKDANGNLVDKGWYYGPLVKLAQEFGVDGKVLGTLTEDEIRRNVMEDRFTIASVHPGVIRGDCDHRPEGTGGGHLVLIWGCRWTGAECAGFYIHNSSGRSKETQEAVFVPTAMFREAFASRGFCLYRRP